ncbi:EF-hand domain-containing protein [Streptomyces jumonjinensis]|uniref:EF-hand domain-containing protein n=1 Tax=Streptomyces jumonjinensis TaxID=1945 RepID=A0A646KHI7_STRJU|nr:EF-hand domain-containing protein [Streptomyces jumonjinensis]MQT01531.1 EF-hand domain-containing protein [Streptomyces jumonjinensis]
MSEPTILDTKLDLAFGLLDTDRDGRVGEADLLRLAPKLATAFASRTPADVERLRAALGAVWSADFAVMDADGDGAVDREEWRTGVRRSVAADRSGFLGRLERVLHAWFALCDTDGDGFISRAEYTHMYGSTLGLTAGPLNEAFTTLDIDGDGLVCRDEIRAAIEEFWTSESRDTPGNWLLGPV